MIRSSNTTRKLGSRISNSRFNKSHELHLSTNSIYLKLTNRSFEQAKRSNSRFYENLDKGTQIRAEISSMFVN